MLSYTIKDLFRLVLFRAVISYFNKNKIALHKNVITISLHEIKFLVISLPFRQDRKARINSILRGNGIQFNFIDAIDGSSLLISDNLANRFSRQSRKHLSSGSIGCILSHEKAMRSFVESQQHFCVIFEDDILLCNGFREKLCANICNIPADFDILYLASNNSQKFNLISWINPNLFIPLYPRSGQYAYLLTRKGAENILKHIYPTKIVLGGIDTLIGRLVSKKILIAYHLFPNILVADTEIESNIQNISRPCKKISRKEKSYV